MAMATTKTEDAADFDAGSTLEPAPAPSTAAVPAAMATMPNVSGVDTDGQLVELWLRNKRSRHTQLYYARHAEAFCAELNATGRSLRTACVADLQSFVDGLSGSDSSRGTAASSIKSLLSFGHKTGYLPFDVGVAVKAPKGPSSLHERILSEADVHELIASDPSLRNRVLLRLLYASGARRSELCGLRWRDVQPRDDNGGQITVQGKGAKARAILLSAATWADLVRLREHVGNEGDAEEPVFPSRKGGKPMLPQQVFKIVRAAAKRAGIDGNVSPHWLRHAHASHALERGAPIHLVQATLGHASVATTGVYLHARPGDSSGLYLAV